MWSVVFIINEPRNERSTGAQEGDNGESGIVGQHGTVGAGITALM